MGQLTSQYLVLAFSAPQQVTVRSSPLVGHDPAPHCGLMGERTIFLASAVLRLGTASLTCKDGPYVPSTHCALLLPERVQVTSS